MIEQVVRIKSLEDIWKEDKKILRSIKPDTKINWDSQLPTDQDAYEILVAQGKNWQKQSDPIILNKRTLNSILNPLIKELQSTFSTNFHDRPHVEVVHSNLYLQRINDLETEVNQKIGYGANCKSPPTMGHFPNQGKIIIPQKYLVRVPKERYSTSLASSNFDVLELDWEKPHFEEVLYGMLSHALFRQLRKEWKEDFINIIKEIGPAHEYNINLINIALSQFLKERFTKNGKREWGLHVVSEKIHSFWGNQNIMATYSAIDALASKYDIKRIAVIDRVFIDRSRKDRVFINFYQEHPYNTLKQKIFEENLEIN